MIDHILNELNHASINRPATGSSETTMKPSPFQIKSQLFLWDMPGLGGLNIKKNLYRKELLFEIEIMIRPCYLCDFGFKIEIFRSECFG